jgi:hypothetical protein
LTVIVASFFESVVGDHSKDHAVAVVYFNDSHAAEPYTTLRDSTRREPQAMDDWLTGRAVDPEGPSVYLVRGARRGS